MRIAHLDEAGTTKASGFSVVAGVVTDPDAHWTGLISDIHDIQRDCQFALGLEQPPHLHATDIWHGKKPFGREAMSFADRRVIIEKLCSLPKAHGLPVISEPVEKSSTRWTEVPDEKREAHDYSLAFGLTVVHLEYLLRSANTFERGIVVAEDNPQMRRYAQWGFSILANPAKEWSQSESVENFMPFERVSETPLFASKADSPILQISDCLAFVIARRLNEREDMQPFLDLFSSQISFLPHRQPKRQSPVKL